ncbi:MAG: helix-turn-helix transcriptional regulator [Thermodesulfobacteriota bacterium]
MLEPMKKRPIEFIAVACPAAKLKAVQDYLAAEGCQVSALVNPDEILPPATPAVFLSGARYREGLTQQQLAERTGIPRRHISDMEHGRRPIGKANAKKLAEALKVEPRRFLSL